MCQSVHTRPRLKNLLFVSKDLVNTLTYQHRVKIDLKIQTLNFFIWEIGHVQSELDDFRVHFILEGYRKSSLDVVCVEEARRHGYYSIELLGYNLF